MILVAKRDGAIVEFHLEKISEATTTAYGYLPYLNVSFYVYFPL